MLSASIGPKKRDTMTVLKITVPRPTVLSDREVIAQILAGNTGVYEVLLRRYNRMLYRAVRGYLREEVDVEDAMQETYLKAFEKLHQFKGEAAFPTWLVRIGINEALQRLRRIQRAQTRTAPSDLDDDGLAQLPAPAHMDPEHHTLHHETRRLVERAIDRLPAAYRTVYMLCEVEGLHSAEVAVLLGLTEGNVKVRLHRAKVCLRESLWQHVADTPTFEFGSSRCDHLVAAVMARL